MYERCKMQEIGAFLFLLLVYLTCFQVKAGAKSSYNYQTLLIDIPGVGWTGGARPHDWGEILRRDRITVYVQHEGPGKDYWELPKESGAIVVRLPHGFDHTVADQRIKPIINKAFADGKDVHVLVDMNITFSRHLSPSPKLGENEWAAQVGDYVMNLKPAEAKSWLASHSRGTVTCNYLDMNRFDVAIVSSPRGDLALKWINNSNPSTKIRIVRGLTDAPSWRWNMFSGTGLGHLSKRENVEIWQYQERGGWADTHSKLQNLFD